MRRYKPLPFALRADASFFEKADAAPDRQRRIAGIASSEEEDQDEQVVLQDGIDWSYFLDRGFLNDNHDKSIAGIIGYPESLERFRKGQKLPDGQTAKAALTWVEGYLLKNHARADTVWNTGLALQGTPRALSFSVEGKSRVRTLDGRTVVKSLVRHLAVTHIPVNAGARATLMLKSLARAQTAGPSALRRAWAAFEKALRPADAAQIISPRATRRRDGRLDKDQAVELVRARHPAISEETARRVVNAIFAHGRRTA